MKKTLSFLTVSLALFVSCTKVTEDTLVGGDIDRVLPPDAEIPADIDENIYSVFDLLNLDYPGLETVRYHYDNGDLYYAACKLLEYFRGRSQLLSPTVDLWATGVTEGEQKAADLALEYKFKVQSYNDDGKYNFKPNKDEGIKWDLEGNGSKEFRFQTHRHQWMLPQAKTYFVTKDEKYILNWIEVYTDWLEEYMDKEPVGDPEVDEGSGMYEDGFEWKGLQTACRVIDQIDIMQYYIQSPNFTPEWLCIFLKAFVRHVEMVKDHYYEGLTNITVTQAQAVYKAGALMPEFKKAGEWIADGFDTLQEQKDGQFAPDGSYFEMDPGYHIGAIADLVESYNLSAAIRPDGYTFGPEFIGSLENAVGFIMDICYPGGNAKNWEYVSIDNFNDTRNNAWATPDRIQRIFRDDLAFFPENKNFEWMATNRAGGETPEHLVKAYSNGYYMIRNGWDKESTMMVLKNNTNSKAQWHCQPDNGTFGLYINGRNFFPDAGCFSYNNGSDRTKYAATANHNTVTIGGKTLKAGKNTDGRKLQLKETEDLVTLVTENDHLDNVTHRRTVFFVDRKYFVLLDEVSGEGLTGENANVDINFHLRSTDDNVAGITFEDSDKNVRFDTYDGTNAYGAHTVFTGTASNKAPAQNVMIKTFAPGEYQVENIRSTVSHADTKICAQRAGYRMTVTAQNAQPVRFISVIYPIEGETETISASLGDFTSRSGSVKVKIGENEERELEYTL